jgi:hypothetical protein
MHMATKKKTTKPKAQAILWNERGQIGCTLPGHAPHKGSDTWRFEHWKRIPDGVAKEDGTPYQCETCAAGERSPVGPSVAAENSATGTPDPVEQVPNPEPVEDASPKKKGRKTKADLTLADLAERYVAHMEEAGKSAGTSASYGLELKTALAELGADTKLADLAPEQVLAYFASKRVTKKKNGKHKSPLSIAKTQRVLRLALVWAVEKKLIEKAPLPEMLATH